MNTETTESLVTLESLCEEHAISAEVEALGLQTDTDVRTDRGGWEHYAYNVRLARRFNTGAPVAYHHKPTAYRMGTGLKHQPTAADVLAGLFADASGLYEGQSFGDWCREMDMDPDSRKARKVWRACRKTQKRLHAFLGGAYDVFAAAAAER